MGPSIVRDDEKSPVHRRRHIERQISDLNVPPGRRDSPSVRQQRRAIRLPARARRRQGAALSHRSDDGDDAGAERRQDGDAPARGLGDTAGHSARIIWHAGLAFRKRRRQVEATSQNVGPHLFGPACGGPLNTTRGQPIVPTAASSSLQGPAMTREEITAMFTRRAAAWQAHDAAALASDHALDAVVVSPTGGVLEGRVEIQRIYQVWFTAFPDLRFTDRDLLIDDHRVVLIMTVAGTHAG